MPVEVKSSYDRRSTIIIFDEATSSLDFETDSIVQKVIREETKGSLLLTGKDWFIIKS